nr:MAG TPA: hypothetical protein [Bacteriophage sp.]
MFRWRLTYLYTGWNWKWLKYCGLLDCRRSKY